MTGWRPCSPGSATTAPNEPPPRGLAHDLRAACRSGDGGDRCGRPVRRRRVAARGELSAWTETELSMRMIRVTAAQAIVRFLAAQRTIVEGREAPLFAGCWAIFGHGNVAGMGEALARARGTLPTFRAHNEQAMALA